MSRFKELLEAVVLPNPTETKLDFTHNDDVPYDEKHFLAHEPVIADEHQRNGIRAYKHRSYSMNKSLFGVPIDTEDDHHIPHITAALKSAPKASEDFHVYTGVKTSPDKLSGDLHIPAFTSASPDHRVAADFAKNHSEVLKDEHGNDQKVHLNHIIKIHVKQGQHVGGYIGEIGIRRHEKEFLIDKGHTLHFTGKTEDHLEYDGGDSGIPCVIRVHHATITPDDEK